MEFRAATESDSDAIAQVAGASLQESYGHFIDQSTIDALVDQLYREDFTTFLDEETSVFLLAAAEDDDDNDNDSELYGFAHGELVAAEPVMGEIQWLHVTPAHRNKGIGVQLLGQIQEQLEQEGSRVVRGFVLEGNESGIEFYEEHGFERVSERPLQMGDETFEELIYEKQLHEEPTDQVVEPVTGPEGQEIHVNYSEGERGAKSPFYATYTDEKLTDRYGWFCGNCESLQTAMDSMGRIICNDCGNKRKATRWDASYL